MTEEQQSAQVVLRHGPSGWTDEVRAAEAPPPAEVADQVASWFQAQGFDTGPIVGISFAISGPASLFELVFGTTPALGSSLELPLTTLADDVVEHVDAVVVPPPPDFGPGNP
jgi:hypothetical protein